jgi:hypothetical protein
MYRLSGPIPYSHVLLIDIFALCLQLNMLSVVALLITEAVQGRKKSTLLTLRAAGALSYEYCKLHSPLVVWMRASVRDIDRAQAVLHQI